MRLTILLCTLLTGIVATARDPFPPQSARVDSFLNAAYETHKNNDANQTGVLLNHVNEILDGLGDEYRVYKGVIHLFQGYYSFQPAEGNQFRKKAAGFFSGSGKLLAEEFPRALYNVMQLHYQSKRMKEWLPVDTVIRNEIRSAVSAGSFRYSIMDYAAQKIKEKDYFSGKFLAMYDYYIFMHHGSPLLMDRLAIRYNDWLVFKTDLEQWQALPFEFRYPEEFSRQSSQVEINKRTYTDEDYALRDKDYKSIFLKLISRIKELRQEVVRENSYSLKNVDRDVRRAYYNIYISVINGFYNWALEEHKEGQVILPLKQFIFQDIVANDLDPAEKAGVKPVVTGYEYIDLIRKLAHLYHLAGNGMEEREVVFMGLDHFLRSQLFSTQEQDYALINLLKDRVRAERLLRNYEASLNASRSSKIFSKLPDSASKNNLWKWENYMDARIEEIYTLLEDDRVKNATDSLRLLMDNISPLDDGTDFSLLYSTRSWNHLQYIFSIIKAQQGEWTTDLLKEALSDIEKLSPLPEIYYPVQLFYFKALFHKEKKIDHALLSNLLVYTARQLQYTFMMLTAEERMILYEKKLGGFFDVYHELLFAGHLDKFPSLKERVIAQSLSLKNSLADGNLIPNELFRRHSNTSLEVLEEIRGLRQEVSLHLLRSKMKSSGSTEARLLKDRVQDMWLGLLEESGMDSLVQLASWRRISSQLKSGQVYTETIRYKKWLSDSSAHYGAYVIAPGGKLDIVKLYSETKLESLLSDPTASPQTASIKTNGNRGGQVTNTGEENKGSFKNGDVDLLGKYLLEPLWPHLSNRTKWYMVQDGLLNRISFAALQWQNKNLFELTEINQLSGSNTLFLEPASLVKGAEVLLAGGLEYGNRDRITPNRLFRPSYEWDYLPGTRKETLSLMNVFTTRGYRAKLLSGKEFPDSLISILPAYNIIHLATHGFYLDSTSAAKIYSDRWNKQSLKFEPLFRSGIVMSGANEPDGSSENNEGYFLGYELANTDLRKCYLVSLSACETGLGDLRNNLGVDGLSRALKIGGARHLLISLWKVPDQPTAVFMEIFYKQLLSGKTPAQALKITQTNMSKTYTAKDWAAFVLVE